MAKGVSYARKVASTVCRQFNLSWQQLLHGSRSRNVSMARGIFCLVCDMEDIHALFVSQVIKKTRQNVVNITRHYRGYYEMNDKEVVKWFTKVWGALHPETVEKEANYEQ